MNKHYLTGPFILVCLFCSASISYACNLPPEAYISDCPKYTRTGDTVCFDGLDSTDHDGYIVDWRWTFPPQAYDIVHEHQWKVYCKFNSTSGIHTVNLEVKDNLGATNDFDCTVYVIKVNLDIDGVPDEDEVEPGGYIAVNTDDDNKNSSQDRNDYGTVENEDDLVEISLSLEPSEPSPLNVGSIKLQVSPFGLLRVWEEPTKGTSVINPTDPVDPTMEVTWDLSEGQFPQSLWVEAHLVHNSCWFDGLGLFYLHPTKEHIVDWDGVKFNPVDVCLIMDGVTEDTEEFPGNYILYNKDDDDDDGVPDYDDGFNKDTEKGNEDDENIYEDDLVKINPGCVEPTYYMTGTVTFDVTSGASKVKIWEPNEYYPAVKQVKYKEISLPVTYNTPINPLKTFYVEGIDPSDGPRDVEFTLSYTVGGKTFKDVIKATIVHVELFRDSAYTKILDDHPKIPGEDLLRSPKYIFGEDDPIYVQVKNIGTDPDVSEYNVVAATTAESLIYLYLKETGPDTQIFRNSEAEIGELLYLSTEDDDDDLFLLIFTPKDKIKVMNEEVLTFWLSTMGSTYKRSEDVMVDRAEIGVEWQMRYEDYTIGLDNVDSWSFSQNLYNTINEKTSITWFKNFNYYDLDSKKSHWHYDNDSYYADSVDIAAWTGHCSYGEYEMHEMLFFKDNIPYIPEPVDKLTRLEIDWGDKDADWVIIHTCVFLHGTDENLKHLVDSEPGFRCAHLICGFNSIAYVPLNGGEYFAEQLGDMSIKQAWFNYCQELQPKNQGVIAKVFGAEECMNDSLAGPGPIKTSRDPTIINSTWTSEIHPVIE